MAMTALFLAAAAFIALLPQESDADTFEITDAEWKIGNNAYLKVTWNVPINEGTITVYLGTDKIAEHEIPPSSTNVSVKVMNPVEPGFYTVHVKTDKGSDTVVKKYPEYTGDVNAFISEDIDGGVVVLLYCDGDALPSGRVTLVVDYIAETVNGVPVIDRDTKLSYNFVNTDSQSYVQMTFDKQYFTKAYCVGVVFGDVESPMMKYRQPSEMTKDGSQLLISETAAGSVMVAICPDSGIISAGTVELEVGYTYESNGTVKLGKDTLPANVSAASGLMIVGFDLPSSYQHVDTVYDLSARFGSLSSAHTMYAED